MTVFDAGIEQQRILGADWTVREIHQQPRIWSEVGALMAQESGRLDAFLARLLARPELRILLTGAGTSAFVGECLAPALTRQFQRRVDAVPSTDLIATPGAWLEAETPTLLVSFARSGNSPESVAAIDVADSCLRTCHHLGFTCNSEGALTARLAPHAHNHLVLLPEEANDRGFAMTSSFTGMLLAAALAFGAIPRDRTTALARTGEALLPAHLQLLQQLVQTRFERLVFLGSATLKGLAHEAALKTLELTDGRVVAIGETPLGFRHGPKTILNGQSVVIMFLSNDRHARHYDLDLLAELRRDAVASRVLSLSGLPLPADARSGPDDLILPHLPDIVLGDLELALPFAMLAQVLAVLRSVSLGLRPDTPNAAGTVNRVVEGVSIYPYDGER
jgi:tagatose-6-phosphate ketose/aldose isomerase